jgi:hypothetical protein
MRRAAGAALVLLLAGWAATLWIPPWADERVNDLFVYRSFTEPVLAGGLPYRDVFFEYPPLAAPAIALPGLAGTGAETFRLAFAGWTLLLAAAVVLLCGALARRTGGDPARAMLAAALAPILLGALVRTHFDLAPVALVLGALVLLVAGRPRTGLALLGAGVMTKGFPLVLLPPALAWLVARGQARAAWQGAGACTAVVILLAGAALAASPAGSVEAVRYHVERPVQVESTAAITLLALDGAGLGEVARVSSHRSDGLAHDAAGLVSGVLAALLVGVVALLTRLVARRPSPRALALASLTAVLAFAVLGKVLSPQFLIWIVPLGALAFAWRMPALTLAVGGAALLTQIEFPARYFDVVEGEPLAVALVAVRDLALLAALLLALRQLQPRRQEQLLDRPGAALAVHVD